MPSITNGMSIISTVQDSTLSIILSITFSIAFPILGSLDNAENAKRHFFEHPISVRKEGPRARGTISMPPPFPHLGLDF